MNDDLDQGSDLNERQARLQGRCAFSVSVYHIHQELQSPVCFMAVGGDGGGGGGLV